MHNRRRLYVASSLVLLGSLLFSLLFGMSGPAAAQNTPVRSATLYFILEGDNGRHGRRVGCGDSAIPVRLRVPATANPIKAAYAELLSVRSGYYGRRHLRNALAKSDLRVRDVVIRGRTAIVLLKGELSLGGECDNDRVEKQLTLPALHFRDIRRVSVRINGAPLSSLLGGR